MSFAHSLTSFVKDNSDFVSFVSKGPPGLTVRGPEGPPGPPGLPGGGVEVCGCNQTLVRQFIKELKPNLIAGSPQVRHFTFNLT